MTVIRSSNGWPIITTRAECRDWLIPGTQIEIPLRPGNAGFVLTHFATNFHRTVEPLDLGAPGDDHGWSPRPISGTDIPSNHWSATAEDLNSVAHPVNQQGTFTKLKTLVRLQWMLKFKYKGMIAWGGNWRTKFDEMHFEIVATQPEIRMLAQELRETEIGREVMRVNAFN